MDKCPYCDGKCDRCPMKKEIVSNEVDNDKTKIEIERLLKKDFTYEELEWSLLDGRII
jgi:hypothetical protein